MAEPHLQPQDSEITTSSSPPPLSPLPSPSQPAEKAKHLKHHVYKDQVHPIHKTLASAASLANLLPTGTVLAFRALTPSFTNKGSCFESNHYLTGFLIGICAVACFLTSFTDTYVASSGKLYYGIATFKGLYIFNQDEEEELEEDEELGKLSKFKICWMDFVHAIISLFVFLVFALSDTDVQNCFAPTGGPNVDALIMNLPLGAGVLASFLFVIFPTTRRGIGYADMPQHSKCSLPPPTAGSN